MIIMRLYAVLIAICVMSSVAVCAATDKPEKTMQVVRCQAVDKKGIQCPYQADVGKQYCWRHRGFVKAMSDTVDDTSKEAGKSWESTKQWSTNVWQKTKSGARSAWDRTKEAADEACENIVNVFDGKKRDK